MQIKAINRGALSALNERSLLTEARAYSSDFFTRSFAEGNFALDGGRHRLGHARVILEKLIKVWSFEKDGDRVASRIVLAKDHPLGHLHIESHSLDQYDLF